MSTPREQMDNLLDEGIRLALYLLGKNKEFFPFAVAIDRNEKIKHIEAYTGEEQPPSDAVIELLQRGLRANAERGEIIGAAIVADIRLRERDSGDSQDAIKVEIEHKQASPVTCYLPYSLGDEGVDPGEIIAERGKHTIFPAN